MRGAFLQLSQLVESELGAQVVGSTFPPAPWKAAAAQVVSAAQMAGLVVVVAGERLLEAAGHGPPPPRWYQENVANNRLGVGVGLLFGGNVLQNSLLSTGAFEVYYDGARVFSKLEEGRMPTAGDVLGPIMERRLAAAAEAEGRDERAGSSGGSG